MRGPTGPVAGRERSIDGGLTRASVWTKAERRRAPRASGPLDVSLITMRGPIAARILDVSITGCRIEAASLPQLAINARISIHSHGIELRAERRWLNGARSGWRFIYTGREQERLAALLKDAEPSQRFRQPFRL